MQTDPSNLKGYGIFVPFVLLLLSVVTWFAFQTSQLISERTNLTALKSSQETVYQNAQKMRAQLDSLAAGTARLSEKGNSNATSVVAALRARGISINPDKLSEPPKQ